MPEAWEHLVSDSRTCHLAEIHVDVQTPFWPSPHIFCSKLILDTRIFMEFEVMTFCPWQMAQYLLADATTRGVPVNAATTSAALAAGELAEVQMKLKLVKSPDNSYEKLIPLSCNVIMFFVFQTSVVSVFCRKLPNGFMMFHGLMSLMLQAMPGAKWGGVLYLWLPGRVMEKGSVVLKGGAGPALTTSLFN